MGKSIVDIKNMGDALRNTGYKDIESAVAEIVDNSIEANAKENNTVLPLEDYTDKVVDDRDSVDSRIDYQLLNEKLNKLLTPNEQQLLRLKYMDDLTTEQVSKVLNVNKQTVAKRLQRLREKIKHSITIE